MKYVLVQLMSGSAPYMQNVLTVSAALPFLFRIFSSALLPEVTEIDLWQVRFRDRR